MTLFLYTLLVAKHNDTGKKGEEVGAQFLMGQGFTILERNKHYGKKEIDILAEKDNVVRIIEVKTVEEGTSVPPDENFTKDKRKNLRHVLRLLEGDSRYEGKRLQIDFLSVVLNFKIREARCRLVQNISNDDLL
jgi:putative endonuclease